MGSRCCPGRKHFATKLISGEWQQVSLRVFLVESAFTDRNWHVVDAYWEQSIKMGETVEISDRLSKGHWHG